MWRKITNQQLRELYRDLDLVADIRKKRFERIGHVERIDQGWTVNLLAPEFYI
jgi:CelD/BcsL family acetyltransferase involved in cellulose biosynthesis